MRFFISLSTRNLWICKKKNSYFNIILYCLSCICNTLNLSLQRFLKKQNTELYQIYLCRNKCLFSPYIIQQLYSFFSSVADLVSSFFTSSFLAASSLASGVPAGRTLAGAGLLPRAFLKNVLGLSAYLP